MYYCYISVKELSNLIPKTGNLLKTQIDCYHCSGYVPKILKDASPNHLNEKIFHLLHNRKKKIEPFPILEIPSVQLLKYLLGF